MPRGDLLPLRITARQLAAHAYVVGLGLLLTWGASIPAFAATTPSAPAKSAPARKSNEAPVITSEQLRSLSWRPIGPANMGGRVSEITLVPGKPHTVFRSEEHTSELQSHHD